MSCITDTGHVSAVVVTPSGTSIIQGPTTSTKKDTTTTTLDPEFIAEVETKLQLALSDLSLNFPIDSVHLSSIVTKQVNKPVSISTVEDFLQKFAAQALIR